MEELQSPGRFKPKCANLKHQSWHSSSNSPLTELRRIPVKLRSRLVTTRAGKGSRKEKICQDCIDHLKGVHLDHSYTGLTDGSPPICESASGSSDTDTQNRTPLPKLTPPQSHKAQDSPTHQNLTSLQSDSQSIDEFIVNALPQLSNAQLSRVARALGELQQGAILRDNSNLKSEYKSLEYLTTLDVEQWLAHRNQVVVGFLEGVTQFDKCSTVTEDKKLHAVAKCVEQVYFATALGRGNSILPFTFTENVVSYSLTGCKLATNINGSSSPGGSYQSIRNWLLDQSIETLPAPCGDVFLAFDNDQVIGRTYHISADNKVPSSVITSVCCAEVNRGADKATCIQQRDDLKPKHWQPIAVDKINTAEYHEADRLSTLHFEQLFPVLQQHIDKVAQEQECQEDSGTIHCQDRVDSMVEAEQDRREWKRCGHCGHRNRKTKRICESCKSNLKAVEQPACDIDGNQKVMRRTSEKISQVEFAGCEKATPDQQSTVKCLPAFIKTRDPIFLNPNTYENVAVVLRKLGEDVGIDKYTEGGERKWAVVVCDGLPYTLLLKVLKETLVCSECSSTIFGLDTVATHSASHTTKPDYEREFDWVLLQIGYGHYELNMLRSFISLNWEVFFSDLAKSMGFRTENALKYARAGSDHHKSWELLQILYNGMLDELVLPYVRECLVQRINATAEGFIKWSKSLKNPNYMYCQEQILTYAQAIINFRNGVRRNDADLIAAGKLKHSPIFHGRNHPKYQTIELTEAINQVIFPPEVRDFMHRHQSFSQSGDPNRGEGLDFQLETINKRSKAWVTSGVPSEQEWQRIFRNLDKLDKLREIGYGRLLAGGLEAPYKSSHHAREEEVTVWRMSLRESGYLLHPEEDAIHSSMSGVELDPQLLDCTKQGLLRRTFYKQQLLDPTNNWEKPDPVFVTPDERVDYHDIASQTKDVICKKVLSLLEDHRICSSYRELWQTERHRRKDDLISFYKKLQDELHVQDSIIECQQSILEDSGK